MRNLLFNISFCGTNYHGWQIQNNKKTVQQTIQNSLFKLLGESNDIKACSRTDSKVHAKEFCFSMKTNSQMSETDIVKGLNALLPEDIAVNNVASVNDNFHARYNAKGKQYLYKIFNAAVKNPFLNGLVWFYKYPLNITGLKSAMSSFKGKHDFSSFCASGSSVTNKERTVFESEVEKTGNMITFKISGDGFLYHMVRIMVGTAVRVSNASHPDLEIENIILKKDRKCAGKTAPPDGLYLNKVFY